MPALLRLGALAGLEEHQRDAVVGEQRPQPVRMNSLVAAAGEFLGVIWVLKAEAPQAHVTVVNAVAVEVHHVIRLTSLLGPRQLGLQGGIGGWMQLGEAQQIP